MSTATMITNWDVVSLSFAKRVMKSGMIFTATFTKANGELRTLNGRTNVTKHVKDTGTGNTNPDNLTVWECNKGQYRTIKLDRLLRVKIFGHELIVKHD